MTTQPTGMTALGLAALAWLGGSLSACSPARPLTLVVQPGRAALAAEAVRFVPLEGLAVQAHPDPERAWVPGGGLKVAWVEDDRCAECFVLERRGADVTVRAGGALGLQYGLYAVLEEAGFRFHHPWRTHVPHALVLPESSGAFGRPQAPQLSRRGLHLHTLHPTESLYDFWVPGEANLEGALRTIDFLVKNRGNYLMWFALDDILQDPARAEAWRAHTRTIVEAAHARGVKVGLKIQLFGHSNLQQAFDLLDGEVPADARPIMRERFRVLLEGLAFDTVNLTFGEFFGADPEQFVDKVNQAREALAELAPGAEMTTMIHVGNYPNLRVQFRGESLLYYFLVKHADARITPWVHSVMYFNLFEDAGGAYAHDAFDEHRDFLLQRLREGKPVAYFPEAAYWIAFDNSVPLYLPLYQRSRHLDLQRVAQAAAAGGFPGLSEHVLFSTGWEWGYWQTDVATLRMTWELPERWAAPLEHAFAPWGEPGRALVRQVEALGELQHRALLEQRLAAYVAGRDQIIDAGERLGIFSQPDRPSFEEVAALPPPVRGDFDANVLGPLDAFAAGAEAVLGEAQALGLDLEDPFLAETLDGLEVTALRARYAHTVFQAARDHGAGLDATPALARADALLARARAVVSRRRAGMHEPDLKPILRNTANPTLYQYGYLREADTLCFWGRERAQLRNLVLQAGDVVPGCVL